MDTNPVMIPHVDMEFDTLEDAWEFWLDYGNQMGFDVRKHFINKSMKDGMVTSRGFVCAKEGIRRVEGDGLCIRDRDDTRTNCPVRLYVKLERATGKYKVSNFVGEHNHILHLPENVYLMRSQQKMSEVHAGLIDLASSSGMKPKATNHTDPEWIVKHKRKKESKITRKDSADQQFSKEPSCSLNIQSNNNGSHEEHNSHQTYQIRPSAPIEDLNKPIFSSERVRSDFSDSSSSSSFDTMDSERQTNIHDGNLDNSSDMELRLSNEVATVRSSHLAQTVEMSQNSSRAESTAVEQDEPYVGQEFESKAAAHAFYNAYGMCMGFKIRVSNLYRSKLDRSIIGRSLVCNKEGYRVPAKRDTKIRSRFPTRVGCKAMLSIKKLSTGKWVVTKFVKEHTHVLVTSRGRKWSMYNRFPYNHVQNEQTRIQELTKQLLIEKKRTASYRGIIDTLSKHIEDHTQYLSEKVQNIADCVNKIASEGKSAKSSNTLGTKM